jgi:hypothetical protein
MKGNIAYIISHYADIKYSTYLSTIQKMTDSSQIMSSTNSGNSKQII